MEMCKKRFKNDIIEIICTVIQSLIFYLPEKGAHKGPFNWLTQSSLDTYADVSSFTMETQANPSTLLFTVGTGDTVGSGPRRAKPGADFGKQKLGKPQPSTSATKKEGTC